jgi:hypothetical protein
MNWSWHVVGCSQSISSTQTPVFAVMLDQWVQTRTTYLNEKCERLTADYKKLCWLVMKKRLLMSGTCIAPDWPHCPGDN